MNTHRAETSTIVLPLDRRASSAAILPIVRDVLDHTGATLHIVSADAPAPLAEALRPRCPGIDDLLRNAVFRPSTADVADDLVRIATERLSLCIVLPLYTDRPLDSGLGPTAEAVLRQMPCPVMLVPPNREPRLWRLAQVVLPQDGTPETARALAPAVRLARRADANLLVLHVSGANTPPPESPGSMTVPRYVDQPHHEWPAWADEFLDRVSGLAGEATDLDLRMFIAMGEPGAEIVRFAREQGGDLIVLPWRGNLAPERAATLKSVLRDAPCPLLVLSSDSLEG
jgi:nucleotide-binding universal stress UspA family protein